MRKECDRYEEAIWEHARTGADLPADAQCHVDQCPNCARAIVEARQLTCLLQETASVPYTPDCRSAVMSKIPGQRATRPAWAYAFASIILLAVILTGYALCHPSSDISTRQHIVSSDVIKPDIREIPTLEPKTSPTPPARLASKPILEPEATRHRIRPQFQIHQTKTRPVKIKNQKSKITNPNYIAVREEPSNLQPATSNPAAEPTPRPIAAVVVSWPTGTETTDTSYSYVEHDAQTGVTTSCSVKRSGDSVEIRLESTPADDNLPVKGSVDDENPINA